MLQLSGAIASLLSVIAFIPYVRDTVSGQTQPERASWLIWSVLSAMAFCSQVYEGARLSLLFAGSQVSVTVLIFLLSVKYGYGKFLTRTNKRLYCVALLGVLTSVVVDSGIYALAVSIGILSLIHI